MGGTRTATAKPGELREMMVGFELSTQQTADLLHVSVDTVKSWLKPATSKSAYPTPLWAVELLRYKIFDRMPNATPWRGRLRRRPE